jgi:hypothetical protein
MEVVGEWAGRQGAETMQHMDSSSEQLELWTFELTAGS